MNVRLIAIAAAAIAGAAWFVGDQRSKAEPTAPPSVVATTSAPAAPVSPAPAGTVPRPAVAAAADEATTLLLPDGSRVPALNGARGCKPLQEAWPASRPWSPIVRVERSDVGVDWYVHADGTRSTTEMKWRADLGRMDALTRLAVPTPQPVSPVPATDVGGR